MKQKKYNDKKLNTINLKNKRTASSTAYKPLKPGTKDYQKSNYDNQTDNKENNRNTDMSMGLGEDKKKRLKRWIKRKGSHFHQKKQSQQHPRN